MELDEIIELVSLHDLSPDRAFESRVDERRDDMMPSAVISLIDDDAIIFAEIDIERLSDIEVMFSVFRIILVERLEDIDQILLGLYDDFLVVVGDIDIAVQLQFQRKRLRCFALVQLFRLICFIEHLACDLAAEVRDM